MQCDKGVDPVWYAAMMRKQQLREQSEKYKAEMEKQFRFVDIEHIGDILDEQGEIASSQHQVLDGFGNMDVDNIHGNEENCIAEPNFLSTQTPSHKRKRFSNIDSNQESEDILPCHMRHVRVSQRVIRDGIYETLADLKGLGLSTNEACQALIKVANNLFGRKWKISQEGDESFDIDTLPHPWNMRHADKLIEAEPKLYCRGN